MVRFEEAGFLKMVGWDRQLWKKSRLIVCCSAGCGGGDGDGLWEPVLTTSEPNTTRLVQGCPM